LSHPGPLECIDDRCLSNNFPIDTGRIFNIDKSERYCNLCNVSELGEEFHYLFKCTFFNNVGANFLPRNICNNPNVFKNWWIHQIYLHLYILAQSICFWDSLKWETQPQNALKYKLFVSCAPQHVFLGWFFTFWTSVLLRLFLILVFSSRFLHLCFCAVFIWSLYNCWFLCCYIMPFVDYIKYWKLISLDSYCHKLESQWNEPGYV
jgi:hypothetical protein